MLKFLGHSVYAFVFATVLGRYIGYGLGTNEWNPLQQRSAFVRQNKEIDAEQKRYNALWRKLFSVNGLANEDKNGFISYDEQFKALNEMGLINPNKCYLESNGSADFPVPEIGDLEKLVRYYETER